MSNHSQVPPDPDFLKRMGFKLGATGRFPEGKLTEHDEGEIQFAIAHKDGKVLIQFGKPVAWLGMTPGQAKDLAESLTKHAQAARQEADLQGLKDKLETEGV